MSRKEAIKYVIKSETRGVLNMEHDRKRPVTIYTCWYVLDRHKGVRHETPNGRKGEAVALKKELTK